MLSEQQYFVLFKGETIEDIRKYFELTKQNEELKINHKLEKRQIKKLKKEYFELKQSNLHCKHLDSCKLKSNKATSFSDVRILKEI